MNPFDDDWRHEPSVNNIPPPKPRRVSAPINSSIINDTPSETVVNESRVVLDIYSVGIQTNRFSLPNTLPPPAPTLYKESECHSSSNSYPESQIIGQIDTGEAKEGQSQEGSSTVQDGRSFSSLFLPWRKSTISYERSKVSELQVDLEQQGVNNPPDQDNHYRKTGRQLTPAELDAIKKRRTVNLEDENSVVRFLLNGRGLY